LARPKTLSEICEPCKRAIFALMELPGHERLVTLALHLVEDLNHHFHWGSDGSSFPEEPTPPPKLRTKREGK